MTRILQLKHVFLMLIFVSSQLTVGGQSRSHLPYSIFGIGTLASKGLGRNLAMGKTGIALASDRYLNNLNPAANFLIDSISFFFDVGMNGTLVNYRTATVEQSGKDLNMNNLAIGFRITPFYSASIGITPYSSVGYKIYSDNYVEGSTDKYFIDLSGSGGLNQFYLDNSFRIFRNISLGVNVSYLFGNIQTTERNVYPKIYSEIFYKKTSYFNKFFVDFGFQYRIPVNEKINVTIGGIFGNQHKLNFKEEISITDSDGNEIESELSKTGTFNIPYHYGGGISFNYNNQLTLTGDYIFHNWDETLSENPYYRYRNTSTFRFGTEYIPGGDRITSFLGMISYRAGFYLEQSYLEVEKNRTLDKGITLGAGFPFLRNRSTINIAFMTGKAGTIENGMIEETYYRLFLSFEMHDWWFLRPQYE